MLEYYHNMSQLQENGKSGYGYKPALFAKTGTVLRHQSSVHQRTDSRLLMTNHTFHQRMALNPELESRGCAG